MIWRWLESWRKSQSNAFWDFPLGGKFCSITVNYLFRIYFLMGIGGSLHEVIFCQIQQFVPIHCSSMRCWKKYRQKQLILSPIFFFFASMDFCEFGVFLYPKSLTWFMWTSWDFFLVCFTSYLLTSFQWVADWIRSESKRNTHGFVKEAHIGVLIFPGGAIEESVTERAIINASISTSEIRWGTSKSFHSVFRAWAFWNVSQNLLGHQVYIVVRYFIVVRPTFIHSFELFTRLSSRCRRSRGSFRIGWGESYYSFTAEARARTAS